MSDLLAGFKCTEKNISKLRKNLVWKIDFQDSTSLSVDQTVLSEDLTVRGPSLMSILTPIPKMTLGKRICIEQKYAVWTQCDTKLLLLVSVKETCSLPYFYSCLQ